MTNQPWMIFRPEGAAVFYIWNGDFAVLLKNLEGDPADDWYWNGAKPLMGDNLPASEVRLLNEVAATKRKQVFTVPRKGKQRFQVVQRGVLEKEPT